MDGVEKGGTRDKGEGGVGGVLDCEGGEVGWGEGLGGGND